MGAKQTKLEGEYLPQTPQQPISIRTDFKELENLTDPRSPHTCRTPINEIIDKQNAEVYHQVSPIAAIATDHPLGLLRKRFFKGFSYNLNDPRSPSMLLNRTPLIFDESLDRTLDLDDTFSDLFVESKIPPVEVEQPELMTEIPVNRQPEEILVETDPRSPSIGVERTPIIITDDAALDEDDMIENFLSTLSINMAHKQPPANKHLERIRNKKKPPTKNTKNKNMIYEDSENHTPPKSSQRTITETAIDSPSNLKRTPLSCVKNHPHLRSRSVEVSGKSIKSRLPLTSFDDTLHKITPVKKILRYSNMENIGNSIEF